MKIYSNILLLVIFLISGALSAQHEEHHSEEIHNKNLVMITFGYSHVPEGSHLDNADSKGIFIPSIGVDYVRAINTKWELALMMDFELDHYIIAKKELERERAFVAVLGVGYNVISHLSILVGTGIEIEQNENIYITRIGTEYNHHFGKNWVLTPSFMYDIKKGYDAYAIAVGIGYTF